MLVYQLRFRFRSWLGYDSRLHLNEPLSLDRLRSFQSILKFVVIFIIVNGDEMFDRD